MGAAPPVISRRPLNGQTMAACRHHIVALTPDRSGALALRTPAGWLLPTQDKRLDGELPDHIGTQLARLTSVVQLVHEAPLVAPAYSATDEFYFLAAIEGLVPDAGLSVAPVDELLGSPALFPVQHMALSAAVSRQRRPSAPFDSAERVSASLDWAMETAAHALHARAIGPALHRCARHEYVARIDTSAGSAYFKGGRDRVADEGALTQLLWTVSPDRVPCTLAIDEDEQRWLYRELEGELLVGSRLTRESAVASVRALAVLQKRLVTCRPVERHLAARAMDARGLFARVDTIAAEMASDAHLATNAAHGLPPPREVGQKAAPSQHQIGEGMTDRCWDEWTQKRDALSESCAAVDALGLPLSLVLSDFWGRNVLDTPNGIGFIDFEHSYWSCPPLPLWKFLHVTDRALQADGALHAPLLDAFVSEWASLVAPERMRRALDHLPLLGRLFNVLLAQHDLELRQRELGDEHPLPAAARRAYLHPYVSRVLEVTDEP